MRRALPHFRAFLLAAAFVFPPSIGAAQNSAGQILKGFVTDKTTGAPLSGVSVAVLDTKFEGKTGEDGRFAISGIDPGSHQILFEKDGYVPVLVRVNASGRSEEIVVRAVLEAIQKEITVTAEEEARPETAASSRQKLSGAEIKALPGIFEDVSRAIQVIPGVASSGDFKNDIMVRGGSPAENLFMLDFIQIPGLSHFGSQNSSGGGFFGLINANLVKSVEFFSGGFPAYYGDKLSSITRIMLREGDRARIRGGLNLSLFGLSGTIEGPLFGHGGSWILSLRKDYFSAIPKDMTLDLTVVPDFADAQMKAVIDISPNLQFSLLGLAAQDDLDIEESDEPPQERMAINLGDRQYLFGVTLKWILGKSGVAYLTLSRTDSRSSYSQSSHGQERYAIRSEGKETTGRADVEFFVTPRLQLMGGFSFKNIESGDHIFYRGGYLVIDRMGFRYTRKNMDAGLDSEKTALYLQASYPLTSRLKATAGVRVDRFQYIRRTAASPRFGLSFELWRGGALHASYGVTCQSPETFWLDADPTNRSLKFLRSEQAVFGFESVFGNGVKITAEIYAKTYRDYPVDSANPYQTLANLGGSVIPTYYGSALVSAGSGYARGFEFSAQNAASGAWGWLIDYAYSVVKFKALDGVLRNGDFDFRHILNAMISCRISPTLHFALKWRLMGGQPYTPFDIGLSTARDSAYFDLTRINTLRYPPYHRLDLRLEKAFVFKRWTLNAYVDIQNIYNRKNIYYKFWDEGQEHSVNYLPLIPFIGLSADF